MTTTAWSHLPNARHIDRVLASLKSNPEKWSVANGVVRDAAWNASLYMARDAVSLRQAALQISWGAAWDAARDRGTVATATYYAAREAAWGVIVALISYDDCAYMLDSDVGELRIIAAFGDPRAILLLPACMVFNELKII